MQQAFWRSSARCPHPFFAVTRRSLSVQRGRKRAQGQRKGTKGAEDGAPSEENLPWWLKVTRRKKEARAQRVIPPRPSLWTKDEEELVDLNLEADLMGDVVCRGCGASFQHDEPQSPGYAPRSIFEPPAGAGLSNPMEDQPGFVKEATLHEILAGEAVTDEWKPFKERMEGRKRIKKRSLDASHRVCRRCFSLKNYGRESYTQDMEMSKIEKPMQLQHLIRDHAARKAKRKLRDLKAMKALVVKVVDIFDFHGSFLPNTAELVGDNELIIVANKADLLPRGFTEARVQDWVRRQAKLHGVEGVKSVHLTRALVRSRISGAGKLVEDMNKRAADNVYCIGAANVGKSSLLNSLSNYCKNVLRTELTTSLLPGTTWSLVSLPLKHGRTLYDTPGVVNKGSLLWMLNVDELRAIVPQKRVKPITFLLKPGRCLYLGGLARVDVISGPGTLVTAFVSNKLPLHSTNIAGADELYSRHVGALLAPPSSAARAEELPAFEATDFVVDGARVDRACMDLGIAGLGWVSLAQQGKSEIRVHVPGGVVVTPREPLMPFDVDKISVAKKLIRSEWR